MHMPSTCVCVHAPGCACMRGSFDASLSGPAPFALFVFNDASREADSRRVERTAFDVSDYDITDVQQRRAEEWGSVLSVFFFFSSFFLSLPSGILFWKKKREGEAERERERKKEEERLNIWPKPECDFVFTEKCAAYWCFCLCCYTEQEIWVQKQPYFKGSVFASLRKGDWM